MWAGGYLIHQIATADTSSHSNGRYDDPHWDPFTPWTLGMGTGTRLVYGLGLLLTPSTHAPAYPWAINAPNIEETLATPHTIRVLRLLAVLCGAIGIGLIALRFGWSSRAGRDSHPVSATRDHDILACVGRRTAPSRLWLMRGDLRNGRGSHRPSASL